MAEPFLGEVRLMSFQFAPRGWAQCNGQLLPINQNQALFSLLGTTFGGNGTTNFALPNLQGRTPIHMGAGFTLGQAGGEQSHILSIGEMPAHNHPMNASTGETNNAATSGSNGYWGQTADNSTLYGTNAANAAMNTGAISNTGGGQAHQNMQPYLTINFCIALQGLFPSRN